MSGFTKVQIKEGEMLFWAGEVANKLYIVQKGAIQLLDPRSSQPLAKVVKGESFGEQCILSDGIRSATAMALEDTECIEIGGDGLRQLLAAQSPLITSLFQALLLQLHMHNTLLLKPKPAAAA